jgi:DNA-binding XRE family transcriptional regulator
VSHPGDRCRVELAPSPNESEPGLAPLPSNSQLYLADAGAVLRHGQRVKHQTSNWAEQQALTGAQVFARRQEAGLSQERLAQMAGISRNQYQVIEGGRGNPRLKTLFSLAAALNVPLQILLAPSIKD